MKKSIVALATLSVLGNAFADVDVSGGVKLYGVLDQSVQSQQMVSPSATTQVSTNYQGMFASAATSRLGVKAQRDLGDNGFIGFAQAEIELAPDHATLLPSKNRTALAGIKGGFGSIIFGTQETTAYEVFGMDVNGRVEYKPQMWRTTTSADTQDRANNALKYITPEMSGFTGHFMMNFNEQSSAYTPTTYATYANQAVFFSYGLKFNKDNFKAAVVHDSLSNTIMQYNFAGLNNAGVSAQSATSSTKLAYGYYGAFSTSRPLAAIQRDIVSLSYDFGAASVNYLYAKAFQNGTYAASNTTNTYGIKIPFDKITLALSYGTGSVNSYNTAGTGTTNSLAGDGTNTDTTFGAYYNFDKSTQAYFLFSNTTSTVGYVDGSNTTTAIGARYNF